MNTTPADATAQRLESIGLMAAGVAHEINTPMQFIGDNVHFLREAFASLLRLMPSYEALREAARGHVSDALIESVARAEDEADVDYLRERVPRAIERSIEGVARVTRIVAAMKAFSHLQQEMAMVDLNKSLENTLIVAHNEYKYVADLETEYGALPLVHAHGGDLGQVFLNLIVNAAHAIEAAVGKERRGKIGVRTSVDGDHVVIAIADSGCGIPESIRHRIFEHFFTTKEEGKGTGQGLSMARSIVVDKHGGSLGFESEVGRGTTFFIRLPIAGHRSEGSEGSEGAP